MWDLTPGITDTYLIRQIEGVFHPGNGAIDIVSAGEFSPYPICITNCAVRDWPGSNPLTARYHHRPWEPKEPPQNPGSLYESPWILDGIPYIGEFTGQDVVQTPPIPVYRTEGPSVWRGETGVQWLSHGRADVLPWVHYRNIDASPWGANAIRCGLWERNGTGGMTYNFVWRGGRLVDQWLGILEANNTVRGTQYYRVG